MIDSSSNETKTFAALDPRAIALLLDVDGTLLDIASTPEAVQVPDDLRSSLQQLIKTTGGALALVSGRLIENLDDLFSPLRFSAIGAHGAQMRVGATAIDRGVQPLPQNLRKRLAEAVAWGALVEDKTYSLALHYRLAPELKKRLEKFAEETIAQYPGEAIEIEPNKMVIEIKRRAVDKGGAVCALMTHSPFAGRVPVFIGDDLTDQSVFSVLPNMGGKGFSVGEKFAGLSGMFMSPAQVRDALHELAARA